MPQNSARCEVLVNLVAQPRVHRRLHCHVFCHPQSRQCFLRYTEKDLVISYRQQPRAGYKYRPQGQGPQRGRDQFDANAYGLAEIRSMSTPTACRRSRGPVTRYEEKPTTCEGCRDDILTEFQGVLCAVVAGGVEQSVVESIVRSDARCLRPVSVFASMKKIGTDPGRKHHERRDIISFFHALLWGCIPGRDHSR